MKKNTHKAFTLIELIVVIAIIAVLVLLAMPKMNNYQQEARETNIKNNIKVLNSAAERYYLDHQKWPRGDLETPLTKEELKTYAEEFLSVTGEPMELDENGKYYSIDYSLLGGYVQKPKDGFHYVIQNPVGEVYYLKDLTEKGKAVLETKKDVIVDKEKPIPVISFNEGILYDRTPITFQYSLQKDKTIVLEEWLLDGVEFKEANTFTKLAPGNHTIKLRVTDNYGNVSEWVEKSFRVLDSGTYHVDGMPGVRLPDGTTLLTTTGQYQPVGNLNDANLKTQWTSSGYSGILTVVFPEPIQIRNFNIATGATPATNQVYRISLRKNGVWTTLPDKKIYAPNFVDLFCMDVPEDFYDAVKFEINGGDSWVTMYELTLN